MTARLLRALVLCAACLTVACGDSPTAPSGPPFNPDATATLRVLVMGHISNGPIVGIAVKLEPTDGGATNDRAQQTTDRDGRAAWRVVPDKRYSISVRDQPAITASLLKGDVQWLVSLPE